MEDVEDVEDVENVEVLDDVTIIDPGIKKPSTPGRCGYAAAAPENNRLHVTSRWTTSSGRAASRETGRCGEER